MVRHNELSNSAASDLDILQNTFRVLYTESKNIMLCVDIATATRKIKTAGKKIHGGIFLPLRVHEKLPKRGPAVCCFATHSRALHSVRFLPPSTDEGLYEELSLQ